MKGSPLFLFVLVLPFCAGMGALVWLITSESRHDPVPVELSMPPTPTVRTMLLLEASSPARVRVMLEGNNLFEGLVEEATEEVSVQLPELGGDFLIEAAGVNGGKLAVRLRVSRDGSVLAEDTYWGEAAFQEVFSVPGPEELR